MKPDVILTWPSSADYPLYREHLVKYRSYFNEIIVTLYPHDDPDMGGFLRRAHPDFTFLDSPVNDYHWRNAAVNTALAHSKSDEVVFTEQDFLWKRNFLGVVAEARKKYDIVGTVQGNRLHPCFIQTSRKIVDGTSKDFDVQGQDMDHFWKFSKEARERGSFVSLESLGLRPGEEWIHMGSWTWDIFRIKKGEDLKWVSSPLDFLVYVSHCRSVSVPQDSGWAVQMVRAETLLSKLGKFLNEE